jgi:hypothetical protein
MAIVGLLRHIGIQLMTLMTPIIPFFLNRWINHYQLNNGHLFF